MEKTMEKIVALAKNRGFVYPGSEIYGGLANTWDYGNLGVELKNNVNQDTTYNVSLQMMNDNGDWKDVDTIKVVVKAGDKYGFTPITGISANQQYRLVLGEFTCLLTAPNK